MHGCGVRYPGFIVDNRAPSGSTEPRRYRFLRRFRLRKRYDFLRVQQAGRRHRGRFLTFLQAPAAEAEGRIGITVSRKVGHSPARSFTRRRLRELYRLHRHLWPTGLDVVVVANPGAAEAPWAELLQEWLSWMNRQSKRR